MISGADTVLTFDPHPSAVVSPNASPPLLTTLERKAELLEGIGVDELVVIPFDKEFASRSAQDFIDEVLVGTLCATHVSVGENFRFGHKAQGDTEMLAADTRFETRVVALLEIDGEVVAPRTSAGSCSAARSYADRLLGRRSSSRARSSTATSAAAISASRPRT